jgi:hypothetical protein
VASQALPSPVTSWNLAFLVALAGCHQRSSTGQGPAQEVIASRGSPPAASGAAESWAGGAETTARPVMVTVSPVSSVTVTGTGAGQIVAGAGAGSRPGQGWPAGYRGSAASPNGTRVTWSAGPRPPASTGRVTAPCPSMAWTRMAARATRSLITASPHRPSWRPSSRTSWSGISRSSVIPPTPTPGSPAP